jgi:hypothetical protein
MGSAIEHSLVQSLVQEVFLQSKDGSLQDVVNDKLARETLLTSLRNLTLALETPEDIVNRVVFFV